MDAIFKALSNERRHRLISILLEREVSMSVADLARELAVREGSGGRPGRLEERAKRIYVSLYHWHVPKLADLDVVVYDDDRMTVRMNPAVAETIEQFQILVDDD